MISSDARTARERLLAAASELIDTLAQQGITQFSSHEEGAASACSILANADRPFGRAAALSRGPRRPLHLPGGAEDRT